MLTKTDLRLVLALEENGRVSYSRLASKLGISVPTVNTRVKSLLKNGVFSIHAVPNPFKLGYNAQAIIGMNIPMQQVRDVCNKLANHYCINLMITTFGRFNVVIIIQFNTWERIYNYISSELAGISDISEIETFLVKQVRKRTIGFQNDAAYPLPYVEIDGIDQKIIEELSRNGRYSCLQLSKELGISASAVSRRLSHLFKEDMIRIQAITDPNKVGYHANAIILLRVDRNKIDNICEKLISYDEVNSVMTLANGYDVYVSIAAREHETLFELVRKMIAKIPGVIATETLIRGEIIKRYYGTSSYWLQQDQF